MEGNMKVLGVAFALAAILASSAHAQQVSRDRARPGVAPQAISDPQTIVYRTSGVRDSGSAINTGVATSFHCTNYGNVSELIRIRVFNFDGTTTSDNTFTVTAKRTHTASTHGTVAFNEDTFLSTGALIEQGHSSIFATSTKVGCSAMILDASVAVPQGISLHMIRYSPDPGTME
jgi:hypothetical protein